MQHRFHSTLSNSLFYGHLDLTYAKLKTTPKVSLWVRYGARLQHQKKWLRLAINDSIEMDNTSKYLYFNTLCLSNVYLGTVDCILKSYSSLECHSLKVPTWETLLRYFRYVSCSVNSAAKAPAAM